MRAKVYNWLVTLFYFYLARTGYILFFTKFDDAILRHPVFEYGERNKLKYLSSWVSVLQTLYFIIVSVADILSSLTRNECRLRWIHRLNTLRHYLLTSLVLPLTLYIFAIFWGFFLYDRELIYPVVIDKFVPPWLNHAMHSLPVPLLLVHLAVCPNHNPSRRSALLGLTSLYVVYAIVFWRSVKQGNWVYLVFNYLSRSQTVLLLASSYPISAIFLLLSRQLNYTVKRFKEIYLHQEKKTD